MLKFIRDLLNGEPVMFVGMISVAVTTTQAVLTGMGHSEPLWASVLVPVWVAISAFYTRSKVAPTDRPAPFIHDLGGGE
jgi:hypothetical protein